MRVPGLLDVPAFTEVGLGRLRQLLSERNRKHPISPEVGLGRLRQLLSERNRKHPISRGMTPLGMRTSESQYQLGDFANAGVDAIRRYCREACARAGDVATEAFTSVLSGIFPAKHSPINLLYCDITLSPPPLSGPEPLSTASAKQASQVGAWLSRANAGIATPGVASAARIAATATVLGLMLMVMSLPVYETKFSAR